MNGFWKRIPLGTWVTIGVLLSAMIANAAVNSYKIGELEKVTRSNATNIIQNNEDVDENAALNEGMRTDIIWLKSTLTRVESQLDRIEEQLRNMN